MKLHYFNVPLVPDTIATPILKYREGATTVNFGTSDLGWGRLTFEKLDSIRVCRGEYSPYPRADKDGIDYSWVSTVSDSKWLRERYDYEKRRYGKCYEFKGNVEEMLSDYIHWVFSFHDEYIEALSAGIWLESAQSNLGDQEPDEQHPLQGLSDTTICERFEAYGIVCQVRRNPLPLSQLMENAKYCSQRLLEIAIDRGKTVGPHWTLLLRVRNETARISLRGYFGEELESYHFVPVLETIRVRIDAELAKIHQRRVGVGKA
jgi:hypothetical protein